MNIGKWAFIVLQIPGLVLVSYLAQAESYELTRNDMMDPKAFSSKDISLFGVKLGDPENKAVDILDEASVLASLRLGDMAPPRGNWCDGVRITMRGSVSGPGRLAP